MLLSSLIASVDHATLHGGDVEITGLTEDSRKVKPGFLFIAIPGTQQDGSAYIADALNKGAAAIVIPTGSPCKVNISTLTVRDIRTATSALAAKFYPHQPMTNIAITGTSGKTSTAQFTREIWHALDYASASIGTLGLVTAQETHYGSLTTPDAITLHRLLDECSHNGITHVAIEASSHGLDLHRLDNVRLKAGGFTNFSRDHLDYHTTMENYLTAKMRLFTSLLSRGSTAVLNADIPEFSSIELHAKTQGLKVISYGHAGEDMRLLSSTPVSNGQILHLNAFGVEHELHLPIIGEFQAWNALCSLGLVIGSGDHCSSALTALEKVTGVPGRLQLAGRTTQGGTIFIDYAHKPDALENVLRTLRPHVSAHAGSKLGVVFGCGGNRDKGKRPIMGEIASRLADWVIVTDDNPRHEKAEIIRQEILAGCGVSHETIMEIGDRARAIQAGIEHLNKNDVLVIAGKGHETGQIIGDETLPFDDAAVARKVLGL